MVLADNIYSLSFHGTVYIPLILIAHGLSLWSACLGMFEAPDTQQYHYRERDKTPKTEAGGVPGLR